MPPSPPEIALRPFPFPYRAALAIASDIDGCTPATFLAVHRFLNIDLGLPVADSCFGIGREPKQMAYFRPDGAGPSSAAPLVRTAIQAGLIDSLHSWGDFNHRPPEPSWLRRLAETLATAWQEAGLSFRIWINHGSPANRQNFLTRTQPEFVGDDPASPWYTADLAKALGIKFYWWMELLPWPLSTIRPWRRPSHWLRIGNNSIKNLVKIVLGRRHQLRQGDQITSLAVPLTLRDGWPVWAFNRFHRHPQGIWHRPTRCTLRYALTPSVLRQLVQEGGFLILYTHLGMPRHDGGPLFPVPDRQALEILADRYHRGSIWVETTARLLTYWQMQQTLRWQATWRDDTAIINITAVHDPVGASHRPLAAELAGLSFYTEAAAATKIFLSGREMPTRIMPPDHTGRGGLMIPLAPPPDTTCLGERWPG